MVTETAMSKIWLKLKQQLFLAGFLSALILLLLVSLSFEQKWFPPLAVLAFGCWFLICFTGEPFTKRTEAIVFSYVFTVLSLIIPFGLTPIFNFVRQEKMLTNPIGIVKGCVAQPEKAKGDQSPQFHIPAELRCDNNTDQWLINVGGTIEDRPAVSPQGQVASSQAAGSATEKKDEGGKEPIENTTVAGPAPSGENDKGKQREVPLSKVSGGLVIPLYFVFLSLMGGAVSLARRVPEIQKRSEKDYVGTAKEPKLQPGEVREYLAFQIMQFITAPLIAVTAYHLVKPDSRDISVALGFSSGFASEAILLMIRGIVDKVKPVSGSKPLTGAVSGIVLDGSTAKGIQKAAVSVVGNSSLKAVTDDKGHFVIEGIPVGECAVEASDAPRSVMAKVIVEGGKTSVIHLTL
jgi:hypothetical protein